MAKPRTVVDLLADQPADALKEMREANRREITRVQEELSRLKVESDQIEQALKRTGVRGGRVTGDEALEAAMDAEPPFSAADVAQLLRDKGREVNVNAIRNHLNRLVSDRQVLTKHDDGRYSITSPEQSDSSTLARSPTDDDIPF